MSLHYLDPEREPRECPKCLGTGYAPCCGPRDRERGDLWACTECCGTGRLGVEGAEPDILTMQGCGGWVYSLDTNQAAHPGGGTLSVTGPFPTEAAALEAARKTQKMIDKKC